MDSFGQHGCRPKHSTADALASISITLEESQLDKSDMFGVVVDLAKAFDNVPLEITFQILEKLGMDSGVLKAFRGIYSQMQRRFKIQGYYGDSFVSTNGILQGRPISVMMLNAIMSIAHKIAGGDVTVISYVDDLTLLSPFSLDLQTALNELHTFMEATGQAVNRSNTNVFGIGDNPDLAYNGEALEFCSSVKILGVTLCFKSSRSHFFAADDKIQGIIDTARHVRSSGLRFELRARVIGGLLGARLKYGLEILDRYYTGKKATYCFLRCNLAKEIVAKVTWPSDDNFDQGPYFRSVANASCTPPMHFKTGYHQ